MAIRPQSKSEARVWVVQDGAASPRTDQLATEEPLEIRLRAGRVVDRRGPVPVFRRQGAGERTVSITMRTPGHDFELAAGFLYGEGIVRGADEIHALSHSDDPRLEEDRRHNVVNVDLRSETLPDLQSVERRFVTTSACGVCGKASLDALRLRGAPAIPPGPVVAPEVLRALPERLRAGQGIFDGHGRPARRRALRPPGQPAGAARGRGPPQRAGQAGGLGAAPALPAPRPPHRDGQRPHELRDPSEVRDGRGAHRVRGVRAQQPGRGPGRGVRRHPRRLPARRPLQRLRRHRARRSGATAGPADVRAILPGAPCAAGRGPEPCPLRTSPRGPPPPLTTAQLSRCPISCSTRQAWPRWPSGPSPPVRPGLRRA